MAFVAIVGIAIKMIGDKKGKDSKGVKALAIPLYGAVFCLAAYLVVIAGRLLPPKAVEVFNPDLNGYYEGVQADNQDEYTVTLVNGLYDGSGKIVYAKDGSSYEGEFKQGVRSGNGTLKDIGGWSYSGEFVQNKFVGTGTYTSKDGSKYVGSWLNNEPSGKGVYTDAKGWKYDGEWKHNIKEGYGVLTLADGTVCTGDFKSDTMNGKGYGTKNIMGHFF